MFNAGKTVCLGVLEWKKTIRLLYFPYKKDIKNAHLGNLKLFTVEEIDKKDYWDFVL